MAFWSGLSRLLGLEEEDFWCRVEDASQQIDQLFAPLDSICSAVAPLFASSFFEGSFPSSSAKSSCPSYEVRVCSEVSPLPQADSESSASDADLESSILDADLEDSDSDSSSDLEAQRSARPQPVQHALSGQSSWLQEVSACAEASSLPQTESESFIADAEIEGFVSDADIEGSVSDADFGGSVSSADIEGCTLTDAGLESSVSDASSDLEAQRNARSQVVQHALCNQSWQLQGEAEQKQQQSDSQDVSSSCDGLASEVEGPSQRCEALVLVCRQGLCSRGDRKPQDKEPEQEDKTLRAGLDQGTSSLDASVQLDWGCLTQIMSHLDNKSLQSCSLVCREWLDASSFARSQVKIEEGPQVSALPRMLARFTRVQVLHIKASSDIKASSELSASGCLDDAGMELIARCCKGLVELHLNECLEFSDAGLAVVLRECSELRSLEVYLCGGVTGEELRGFTCGLEKLELSSDNLTNEGLVAAVTACPNLRDLDILNEDPESSLDEGLSKIARLCGKLTRLRIHGASMSDQTLSSFAVSCPLLKDVSISCQSFASESTLPEFFARQPGLESVTLSNILPFETLPRFGPRLKKLQIGCCWEAHNPSLQQVAEVKTLEELRFFHCPFLKDAGVEKVLAGCNKLKRLCLKENGWLTVETARAFARSKSQATMLVEGCENVQRKDLTEELLGLDRLTVVDNRQ